MWPWEIMDNASGYYRLLPGTWQFPDLEEYRKRSEADWDANAMIPGLLGQGSSEQLPSILVAFEGWTSDCRYLLL